MRLHRSAARLAASSAASQKSPTLATEQKLLGRCNFPSKSEAKGNTSFIVSQAVDSILLS
jgi:hypothetical protein